MKYLPLFTLLFMTIHLCADDGKKTESDPIQSIREERRETLMYGIDSQVIDVLESLGTEQDTYLLPEVFTVFKVSVNSEIKIACLKLFGELEYRDADDDALAIIENYEDHNDDLVLAAIRYMSTGEDERTPAVLAVLLDIPNEIIASVVIEGIGESGKIEHVDMLLERLRNDEYPSNLKPTIILALGSLGHEKAVEPLMEIVEDRNEDSTWRRYACDALGKIGDPRAIVSLQEVLSSSDAILRSYAVFALGGFEEAEIIPLLIQSLKDSFWRVRISACRSLAAKKANEAIPILVFKAKKDPEMKVREAATTAIGEINNAEGNEILREFYMNELTPQSIRLIALENLIEYNLEDSLESIQKVIQEEWDKKSSKVLERTAYHLSLTESPSLEPVFSRFLSSGEIAIIIYGIRGIERNKFGQLKEFIENLSAEGNQRSIRQAALAALENL